MLAKLHSLLFLYRLLGPRWLAFRFGYALRMRLGLLRWQMPPYAWDERPLAAWLKPGIPSESVAYATWRRQNTPPFFFLGALNLPTDIPWVPSLVVKQARRFLGGEFQYFGHTWYKVGFPPDWMLNPFSQVRLDSRRHWSETSDDGRTGDIKFIWEANRFGMVYTLVRAYASNRDDRLAEAFWSLIQSWADSNPPNRGPNWKDGQECALRLMAWIFGLYSFWDLHATTPERIVGLTSMIAALAQRIARNVDFATSTRGNHSISEAAGLWIVGLLFPELKDAEMYRSLGLKLLEQEARVQIFPDGAYAMYSLNYQRFVLQIYLYVLRLAELHQARFSDVLREALSKSLEFMIQLVDAETGQMPVFGSNDGALPLPLSTCDFTDYRPVLQLGCFLLHGKRLFANGPWDETLFWLCGEQALRSERDTLLQVSQDFLQGGVHVLREPRSMAVVRCVDYRERPSHADQLHVDLWMHGQNIACDAGTYLYSGEGVWRNGLARTSVHNTVTVDARDQMRMLSRFTWTDWAQGRVLRQAALLGVSIWQGEHDGYQRLPDPVRHKRTVLMLGDARWLIVDRLYAVQAHKYRLHWLLNDFAFTQVDEQKLLRLQVGGETIQARVGLLEGDAGFSVVRGDPVGTRGWRSRYYGHKEPAISIALETSMENACFWSFFGFDSDEVQLEDISSLRMTTPVWKMRVRMAELDSTGELSQTAIERMP